MTWLEREEQYNPGGPNYIGDMNGPYVERVPLRRSDEEVKDDGEIGVGDIFVMEVEELLAIMLEEDE